MRRSWTSDINDILAVPRDLPTGHPDFQEQTDQMFEVLFIEVAPKHTPYMNIRKKPCAREVLASSKF